MSVLARGCIFGRFPAKGWFLPKKGVGPCQLEVSEICQIIKIMGKQLNRSDRNTYSVKFSSIYLHFGAIYMNY